MGDFNAQPFSVPIAMLRSHASLSDSFQDTHPSADSASSYHPSPSLAIRKYGMTVDSPINTYSAGKPISGNITAQGGKRLDYIFYRQPAVARRRPLIWGYRDDVGENGAWNTGEIQLEEGNPLPQSVASAPKLLCVKSQVLLTDLVPGEQFSYSDHFALCSIFSIEDPAGAKRSGPTASDGNTAVNSEAASFTPLVPLISEAEALNAHTTTFAAVSPPRSPLSPRNSLSSTPGAKSTAIRSALNTLQLYTHISQRTARLHFGLFIGAAIALVGLTIGSAWQPKSWLQPIFTLLGGVFGASGATFLYTGFVWGKWEMGLLTETTEEMELELRVVEMEERTSDN